MTINIPAFVQSQLPVVPLKGNWNRKPKNPDGSPQDDMFVSQEIDWLAQGATAGKAIQFSMSGNSPVTLGQIAALVVDNSRCGSDVQFYFPDTGFELTVDARAQGIFPVMTNALVFFAIGNNATNTDITIMQVCNTVPPPVAQFPASAQQVVGTASILIGTGAASTALVAAGINGTLQSFSQTLTFQNAAVGGVTIALQDGTGAILWQGTYTCPAGGIVNIPITSPPGLNVRFRNGLNAVTVASSAGNSGSWFPNVYVSIP
jgi:hypothetical protein